MRRLIRRLSKILLLCLFVVGGLAIINFVVNSKTSQPTAGSIKTPIETPATNEKQTKTDTNKRITDLISDGSSIFVNYDENQGGLAQEIQKLKEDKQFQTARQKATFSKNENYCGDPEILIGKNNNDIKNKESYAIAVVVPLESTKDTTDAATEIIRGVAQAQNEYNEQINNQKQSRKPLKVFIVNEKEKDESTTKSIATDLVNKTQILGVIGHYTSDATQAAVPIYNKKLVLISPTSTKTIIQSEDGYFFRTVPNNKAEAEALVNYLLKNQNIQPKKAAIIYNNESQFSQSLKEDFINSFRDKTNQNISDTYDLQQSNITPDQLINDSQINGSDKKFSVLMLAGTINDINRIYLNLQVRDAQKFFYLGGDTMYVPKLLTLMNGDIPRKLRNIAIAVPWHHTHTNTESQNFVKRTSELWCQTPGKEDYITWRRTTAYDATNVLIKATNNSPNPSRETVKETLSKNFFMPGITGTITFKENGDLDAPSKLVRLFEYDISGNKTYKFKLVDETGNSQSQR